LPGSQYAAFKGQGGGDRKETAAMVGAIAKEQGIDPGTLVAMGLVESGLNPSAKAKKGTAKGLFQFIDSTWSEMMNKHGKRLGIPSDAKATDPVASTLLAVEFLRGNARALAGKAGVPEKLGARDYYAAHFFGAGGAAKFYKEMQKDPSAKAKDVFPKPAKANKNVFHSGSGTARSLKEVYDSFGRKLSKYGAGVGA